MLFVLIVYISCGILSYKLSDDLFNPSGKNNPLLKPVYILIWPITILFVVVVGLFYVVCEYIHEVIDYYRDKTKGEE